MGCCADWLIPDTVADHFRLPKSGLSLEGLLDAETSDRIMYNVSDQREIRAVASHELTLQLTSAFFDGAQTYSQAHDPAQTESLASYLYKRSSPLFDGLDSADARKRALYSMRFLSGWTGAELEDVSLRYWAFTPNLRPGRARNRRSIQQDRRASRGWLRHPIEFCGD